MSNEPLLGSNLSWQCFFLYLIFIFTYTICKYKYVVCINALCPLMLHHQKITFNGRSTIKVRYFRRLLLFTSTGFIWLDCYCAVIWLLDNQDNQSSHHFYLCQIDFLKIYIKYSTETICDFFLIETKPLTYADHRKHKASHCVACNTENHFAVTSVSKEIATNDHFRR